MPVNVVMPQMGESIAEGTIVRWLKKEGEEVKKDEPLLEISTDKVDAEVPSPAAGVLGKILHGPGETVAVETVLAEILGEGEAASAPQPAPAPAPPAEAASAPQPAPAPAPRTEAPAAPTPAAPEPAAAPAPSRPEPPDAETPAQPEPAEEDEGESDEEDGEADALRRRSSPLVRRIAREHEVDLAAVPGTGIHGRVTKADILSFIEGRTSARPAERPAPAASAPAPRPAPTPVPTPAPTPAPTPRGGATGATLGPTTAFTGEELREPLSVMRQKIAEHMVASRATSPHTYTLFEADVSRVVALRTRERDAFEAQHGLKLTYTPFFLAAAVDALKAFPVVNASLEGNEVVYHRHINFGVAVALPQGLIVPVVKRAEELSLLGLQRAITDLANRARAKQLKPEDVRGSTFAITNPGPYGGLFGLPIINQPNAAILLTGSIERRPVVVTDGDGRESVGIRDMVYLALSFDHRLIDGATADQFMARLKSVLEAGAFNLG